ncbi:MAG: hypothetical protein Q4F35_08270, partial [Akkermansia sp.]|nr:hypothetical protein [Akkermansia sp.]
MKLHLPKGLRSAVLACMAVVGGFAATVATGAVTGGVVAFALALQAQAAYDEATATYSGNGNKDINPSGVNVPSGKILTFALSEPGGGNGRNYFSASAGTYDGDIIIGGTESGTGLLINDGSGNTVIFSGAVTGSGTISKKGAGEGFKLHFSGDVSNYTGRIELAASRTYTLKFSGVNNSSAEKGVSGTGDIVFSTANNTLVYDYSDGKTVYVTNAISWSSGDAKVTLNGTDAVVFTKNVNLPTLVSNASRVTFNGAENVIGAASYTNTITSALEVGSGATLTLKGTLTLSSAITNGGALEFDSGVMLDLSALTAVDGVYTIFTGGTTSTFTSLSVANISNYDTSLEGEEGGWVFDANGTIYFSEVPPPNVLVVGSDGVAYDSSDVAGKNTIRLAGGTLTLGDTDVAAALTTLETRSTGGAIVATGTENEVTFSTVTVSDGATITLKDGATDLTVKANALSLGEGSSIMVEAGQVLDLTAINYTGDDGVFADMVNAVSGAGTVKANASGTVVLRKDATLSTNLEMAALELNSWKETNPGKVLTIAEEGSLAVAGTLIVESTASVKVEGGELSAADIKLGHTQANNFGHLSMTGGSITTSGITVQNGADTGCTFTMSGGTLEITGANGIASQIVTTITGGSLVANSAAWGVTGATISNVTISGSQKITLTDATLNSAVTNNGSLALSGALTANNIAVKGSDTPTYTEGDNGYAQSGLVYTIVSGSGTLDVSGLTALTVNGEEVAVGELQDNGTIVKGGEVDYSTYHVRSGSVAYNDEL